MSEMISFGAGINSVAMDIMFVNDGWRGPIGFADTGGEHPEALCYMEYFTRAFLEPAGLAITTLSPKTHAHLYDDKRLGNLADTLEDYCLAYGIIPFLAVRWCSIQFKRNPVENWREELGIQTSLPGISASEPSRVKNDGSVRYPLYEEGVTRGECRRIIQRAGVTVPDRSSCFFCRVSG